ncbi:tubulin-like doman-containing protein [Caulobacter sp.]|uniref:tubulin-like doman-containing protein n=1 Tax=Caulobacter sp. TaxID=78 RepID=UPI003BAB9F45
MNHLMIGLGGTGGRVLRAMRKSMYRSFRDRQPDNTVVDYLFVDSDPKSFVDGDPAWTVLGKSIHLPKRSQMLIAQANLNSIVDDLNAHPNLKPWIGDRTAWGEILASLNIDSAGGQKRRLGRFLFAMSARKFRDSVSTIVADMQQQGPRSTDVTFHIFCGLAGGTGSGAIVDTVAQLRAMYPDPRQKIVLYLYLPDLNPPAKWNTGNYHANAYAALMELNAMGAGAFAPFDVVGGGGPVKNPGGFWYNGAYVFTDDNNLGFRAAIDRDLPDILADFVFQKVIVARKVNWDGLVRMENSENGDASPEISAGAKIGQRSVRFLSFGVRRIAFPEEAIRESLTYDFEMQGLRQLAFNNWQDGVGYLENARPRANAEFVADKQKREDWRLTDDHLRLQRPIIDTEGSKRWKTFAEEWETWETHYVGLAQQTDRAQWLNELKTLFQTAWSQNFRNAGVPQFFQAAGRDRKNLAQAIRNLIEQSLFEDWRNGVRAISENGRVVDALLVDIEERLNQVADFAAKRESSADDLDRQFGEIERKWNEFRLIPGSREREMTKAGFILREQYTARTLAEAARFSRSLMEDLRSELTDLASSIDAAEKVVTEAADRAMKRVQARKGMVGAAPSDAPSYVTTIGDAGAVEKARRTLVLSEEEQRTHTAKLRQKILEALGNQPTFSLFSRRLAETDVQNALTAASAEEVASAHQRLVTEKSDRVIGVSVIDKLRDQWGDDQERLNSEAAALTRGAGRFISFDEAEVNKSFPGKSPAPRGVESFAVIVPAPPEQKDFVDKLERAFKNARPGGDVDFIRSDDTSGDIALVTLVNLFPLRFARVVRGLRDRYNDRLAEGKARAQLEVHTEGDGSQFPELFVADRAQVATRLRPVLLVGVALGAVATVRSQSSGRDQLVLVRKDADGFDLDPLVLGDSALGATEGCGETEYFALEDTVEDALGKGALTSDPDREAARTKIMEVVESVKAAKGGDATDPEVAAWNSAARDAMKLIRREA